VLQVEGCPDNQTVLVTHNGGNGAVSFAQFLDSLGSADNRTYVITASDTPYVVGCRSVNIGSAGPSAPRSCIVIRGSTGDREDVVIVGQDPAVDPDFWKSSQYGGPSSCGIGQFLQFYACEHVVVADLTLRNFPGHMVKLDGGYTDQTAWYPEDVVFHNLELHDCGDQMIKAASGADENPIGSRSGLLSCSYLHYTEGLFEESSYETQGIDLHGGRDWIVRDNVFDNIRVPNDAVGGRLGTAVMAWDRSDSVLVERNLIRNCNMAIVLGASWYDDSSDNMTAINNIIVYDDTDTAYRAENTIDIGISVTQGMVAHNTIWNPEQRSDIAFAVCHNAYTFANNVYYRGTTHRCASEVNNVQAHDSTWFKSLGRLDFRPCGTYGVPSVGVEEDVTGQPRVYPPTVGAVEFRDSPVSVRGNTRRASRGHGRHTANAAGVHTDTRVSLWDIAGRPLANSTARGETEGRIGAPLSGSGCYVVVDANGARSVVWARRDKSRK